MDAKKASSWASSCSSGTLIFDRSFGKPPIGTRPLGMSNANRKDGGFPFTAPAYARARALSISFFGLARTRFKRAVTSANDHADPLAEKRVRPRLRASPLTLIALMTVAPAFVIKNAVP